MRGRPGVELQADILPRSIAMRDVVAGAVTIRPAEFSDVPAMAAIRAQEWETLAYWERRIGAYLRGEIGAQHALQGYAAVFVAIRAGAVIGFIAGHRTTRHGCQGELEWMDVAAAHRRQGVAGRLIVTLAGWFVEQEALRVCIDVKPENTAARGLYAKFGAAPLNPHWMVWEDVRVAVPG
ncbi:MAG: GNAT family N-acetyltransferase [Acidobacteriaceae bacterium]|jgi:ribosomal protein S18 acetylase RimI-like enzyme